MPTRDTKTIAVRALTIGTTYFLTASAAIAIAVNLSSASQWFDSHGKNTITLILGLFASLGALAMVVNHVISDRHNRGRFFASRSRTIAFSTLIAVALVMFGIRLFDPEAGEPPIVAQGHPTIANVQGVDLDIDDKPRDQDMPGVDLSPSKTGDQLNAMTHGTPRFAMASDGEGSNLERCSRVPDDKWSKVILDAYSLRLGGTLCVRTDQGNLATLVLTHVPSAGEQYIAFTFVTWQRTR